MFKQLAGLSFITLTIGALIIAPSMPTGMNSSELQQWQNSVQQNFGGIYGSPDYDIDYNFADYSPDIPGFFRGFVNTLGPVVDFVSNYLDYTMAIFNLGTAESDSTQFILTFGAERYEYLRTLGGEYDTIPFYYAPSDAVYYMLTQTEINWFINTANPSAFNLAEKRLFLHEETFIRWVDQLGTFGAVDSVRWFFFLPSVYELVLTFN